jgi:serine/threonine protein kinase
MELCHNRTLAHWITDQHAHAAGAGKRGTHAAGASTVGGARDAGESEEIGAGGRERRGRAAGGGGRHEAEEEGDSEEEVEREHLRLQKIRFIVGILRGLRHIHAKDICHRDLKPANLFLSREGVVKLGDFGLAKSFAPAPTTPSPTALPSHPHWQSPSATHATYQPGPHSQLPSQPPFLELAPGPGAGRGQFSHANPPRQRVDNTRGVGTALYAAPEQMTGSAVNGSADIFSLGVIIVELFCVFGSGMERIIVLSNARDGHLPQHFTQSHPEISALARKCLEREPSLRPSAHELLDHFCPMIEQIALPPLLELADKTIASLRESLREREAREKVLETQVEELRTRLAVREKELAAKEREVQQRDATIAQLRPGGDT